MFLFQLFSTDFRFRAFHHVSAATGENVDATLKHMVACCVVARSIESEKLSILIPDFILKGIAKIASKLGLNEMKDSNPFYPIFEGYEP